jgi:hypothetical protein
MYNQIYDLVEAVFLLLGNTFNVELLKERQRGAEKPCDNLKSSTPIERQPLVVKKFPSIL